MRARNIKPGTLTNEELADMGPYGQILFIGLWQIADREGKLEDRARRIKAQVFPYYEPKPSIGKLLDGLAQRKFIQRYEINGLQIIKIINFLKHQSPHHSEKKSILPEPSEVYREPTVDSPETYGRNRSDSLNPDSLNPDTRKGTASPIIFSCVHFEINQDYLDELLAEWKILDKKSLHQEFVKMEDWFIDNPSKHKRRANGQIKNPRSFIRNWLTRLTINPYQPQEPVPKYHAPAAKVRTPENIHEYADPKCPDCGGTGIDLGKPCDCTGDKRG